LLYELWSGSPEKGKAHGKLLNAIAN
jgi:hypothetical protein